MSEVPLQNFHVEGTQNKKLLMLGQNITLPPPEHLTSPSHVGQGWVGVPKSSRSPVPSPEHLTSPSHVGQGVGVQKVPERAVDDEMIQRIRAIKRYRYEMLAQAAAAESRSKELKDL